MASRYDISYLFLVYQGQSRCAYAPAAHPILLDHESNQSAFADRNIEQRNEDGNAAIDGKFSIASGDRIAKVAGHAGRSLRTILPETFLLIRSKRVRGLI